jgi:hypothetical protein
MQEQQSEELDDDDYLPEFEPEQFAELLRDAEWGKYAKKNQEKLHLVNLADDVYEVFPTADAVNQALRQFIEMKKTAV